MALTAASLLVKVGANTTGAEAGIGKVSHLLGKVLPAAALGGAVAVAGIGLAAVKMAGDFQQGMTSLVTGAGEAQGNIKLVSAGILNMAVATGTSTDQLTAGMFMIESAGFHGAAGLNVLKVAAQGAKVGNADLGTTSDALTTILKDYPNVTNGAAGAMNSLIATVASGKTHMQDLAGAMAQILPTSSAANVGLNDVMGAMATMTGEGVPAANAATYLRQTILALDAPSKTAQTALKNVGLSSSAVASEMQQSLPGALKMITDAVGKKFPVGSAAYVAAIKDIAGGSKQMQGVLDLTGTHMGDFTANVKTVADQVKKDGQTIVGWSDVQGDFNFKVDKAKEVVQTLMIKLGTGLLPVAGKVVDLFSTYLVPTLMTVVGGVLSVATAMGNFITWLGKGGIAADAVIVVLAALGGAMAGMAVKALVDLIPSVIASITAFYGQATAAAAAAVATLAAAAPFILVGLAIGGLIAIVVLVITHFKQLQEWFTNLKTMIRNVVENILGLLSHIPGPLGAMAAGVLANMKSADDATQAHTLAMKVAVDQHTEQMAKAAVMHTDVMRRQLLQQIANTTDPAQKKALEMKLGVVMHTEAMQQQAVLSAAKLAQQHTAQMKKMHDAAVEQAREAKLGVLGHLGEMKDKVFGFIGGFVHGVLNWFGQLFTGIITNMNKFNLFIMGAFTQAINSITGVFRNVFTGLWDIVKAPLNLIIGGINSLIAGLDHIHFNVPSWVPAVGGKGFGVDIPQIPLLAQGGTITQSGYVVVGDAGPELLKLPSGAQVAPLTHPSPVGLPAGMQATHGMASATAGGITIPITLVLDNRKVAQAVLRITPELIRNATGARNF